MKKQRLLLLAALLLTLCACTKQPAQQLPAQVKTAENPMPGEPAPEQQISSESDTQPADAPTEKPAAPESFVATETVPSLPELQGSKKPAESLLFLKSQQYGPITASYYAAAPNLDVWDVRQALFGITGMEMPAQMERPDDLGFDPFRTWSNPSATYLLICKEIADTPSPTYCYDLYDGEELCELTTLNDRPFGTINPAHIRWRDDDELVYDVENPETGKFTTHVYNILTQTERVLLADYDPYPFYAVDTVSERYLLVHDTYALRVERGGTIFLRTLPDGDEIAVPELQTPETAYFHITPLDQQTALYFAADENHRFTTLAFIDCESGSCAKLERSVSDDMDEQFIMLLDESTVAIPANAGTADGGQNYLLIYDISAWRNPPFAGGITLYAGSDTALVNSEPVEMPAAPFVENDIFYIPLQFVAETMGWEYQYEDGTVRLQSSLHWTTLTVGERTICADGVDATVTGGDAADFYVPVERDGIVFMPLNFLSARTDNDTRSSLSFRTQMFPEDGYVLLSGHGRENGIGGFYVWDIYDNLPEQQRACMRELGVVAVSRDVYNVVEYGADGLFVHVLRLQDGYENTDQLDGYISAVYTTNPDIPTPRGLRVGESVSRISTTYDGDLYMQLLCITEDDSITKIRFFSYYDEDPTILRQPTKLYMDAADVMRQDELPS